jgi:TonB-linked SusC/RagA family outer membrane protein
MRLHDKLLVLMLLLNIFVISGQSKKEDNKAIVSGVVYASNGVPLSDVTITMDEGKARVVTETDGKFTFNATKSSVFIFEHVNFEDRIISTQQLKRMDYNVVLNEKELGVRKSTLINLPYHQKQRIAVVGDISVIDVQKEYLRDSRGNIASAINGKVSGSLGGMNINGLGNAFTVVDGIPMGVNYTNLRDVEQIVVLKDATSRLLYGVETDIPVVLITTKSGKPYTKELQFMLERGVQQAIAYPKFLNAASYMETYNRAYRNDGATDDFYSFDRIDKTRSSYDPILYPNNDYYSTDYVNSLSNYTNVYGTVSGGNNKTQYLLSFDWINNPGWNSINNNVNNVFNVNGRVDFEVNKWLKMNSQVLAAYNLSSGPNIGDFWMRANTYLPNAYPELIPIDRINNLDAFSNYYEPVAGLLLGGTSIYQNTMRGDLMRSGSYSEMRRYVQSRMGFDIDLSSITKGLKANASVGYDFFNVYKQVIQNEYSIYEIDSIDSNNNFSVNRIGVDKVTTQQSVSNTDMRFNRSVKWNYLLNYNRRFSNHDISAVALGYGSYYTESDLNQAPRKIAFGAQATYMYGEKYMVEAGLLSQSSMKVNPSEKYGNSKSLGLGWIISNEDFLVTNDLISYLKLRGSYGQFVSDAFIAGNYNGYFLNENIYSLRNNFLYHNGKISNRQIQLLSLYNHVGWEKRNELSLGVDFALIKNKLFVDATYTNSYAFDNVTAMNVLTPSIVGGISTYENYNATDYKTYNLGVNYQDKIGDFELGLALYYTRNDAIISKFAENIYTEPTRQHLKRTGTDARGLWGLQSERLYLADDFDSNGSLKDGLPIPAWGKVMPGDIKYIDYNGDGIVNEDDVSILGRNSNNVQISLNIDLKYKQWQLFLLPLAQMGGVGIKSSDYYWFKGNQAKYSEQALHSFDENNPDPNAAYPRLSLGSSQNNYRNSTFWLFDKSYFELMSAQLSYNMYISSIPFVTNIRLFAKGNNLFMIAKDREVLQLNYGSTPQSRVVALGAIVVF